jgi:glycosyltransferase 2 family protein
MKRKQIIAIVVVVVVLGVLVYLQIRTWRHFDWEKFRDGSEGINWWRVLLAIGLIYFADFLRAARWKIFLRPSSPNANWRGLIAPQYVGFAGLALLGRPGEFIRPYLIARRENLTFGSQVALWFVERAFDTGAVTIILAIDLFLVPGMREDYPRWQTFGYALIAAFLAFGVLVVSLAKRGPAISAWVCRRVSKISSALGSKMEARLRALSSGLDAIHDWRSFVQCALISLIIWMVIAFAYRQVTHAYPVDTGLPALDLREVILLMSASVAGGVVQLPVVGGGSQLATIAVLSQTFGYSDSPELAVSCGMLLWLVTFMSVTPLGLALARYEHVSLRKITEESQQAERAMERGERNGGPNPPIGVRDESAKRNRGAG